MKQKKAMTIILTVCITLIVISLLILLFGGIYRSRNRVSETAQTEVEPTEEMEALTIGDLNEDGNIDIADAALCLSAYANQAAGNGHGLTDRQFACADVDGDGAITVLDASDLLVYYANAAAGNTLSWEEIC